MSSSPKIDLVHADKELLGFGVVDVEIRNLATLE
jgi:hypothetical protein